MNGPDLEDFKPGAYGEVPEIMNEIFHRLLGQQITLSSGRVGTIKKFVEPKIDDETGKMKFGFDVTFESGSPDHLEFYVRHTGGGGFVSSPAADPRCSSDNPDEQCVNCECWKHTRAMCG